MMDRKYYENGDITTIVEFRWAGYGINAQSVYDKIITTFSVADGIIKNCEIVPYKKFCRK